MALKKNNSNKRRTETRAKKYGTFEYGDIYDHDPSQPDGRGKLLGRLVVDQDEEGFYCRGENKAARRLSRDQVGWMVAKGLIEFDHADSQDRLLDYMIKLEERKERTRKARAEAYAKGKVAKQMEADRKLIKKTKRRARFAKFFWFLGCMAIVGLGVIMMLPEPDKAPAIPSIAGEGTVYQVSKDVLSGASYMTVMGNGSELYGLIIDNEIVESGTQNNGESTIKENVLLNANISPSSPLHLRPLYYDRNTFYQSQLTLNDAGGGSTAVCLQNPDGYGLGHASNELVFMGGKGMSSVVLSSPGAFSEIAAGQAAREIERNQRSSSGATSKDQRQADKMPTGWIGYDYADIDASKVAASYWYTKNSTSKKEDLRRRVVIWDVSSVMNAGADATRGAEAIQLNYQDLNSNFYKPVISKSPSSNGSTYWLGYMKTSVDGQSGFYIRKYDEADDILLESYDNTLSTRDLTGADWPISNYTLNGDRLFFEQQGYIWAMDLSKIRIEVEGTQRKIEKEDPIRICLAREIKQTVTRDEQFLADEMGVQTTPISHYQVITVTTDKGVEYGIAFVENDTGNLVFQPCNGAIVASADVNKGTEGNNDQATGVSNGDQTEADRVQAEKDAKKNKTKATDNTSEGITPASQNEQTGATNASSPEISGAFSEVDGSGNTSNTGNNNSGNGGVFGSGSSNSTVESNGIAEEFLNGVRQSAYTIIQAADAEVDTGRILIRAGNDSSYQIICFCVRGEQFYWMEQSQKDNSRRILMSPVFYRNDAAKLLSDAIVDDGKSSKGIQVSTETIDPSQKEVPEPDESNSPSAPDTTPQLQVGEPSPSATQQDTTDSPPSQLQGGQGNGNSVLDNNTNTSENSNSEASSPQNPKVLNEDGGGESGGSDDSTVKPYEGQGGGVFGNA